MGTPQRERLEVDDSLLNRVASLPPSGQRWLKTALQAIATIDPVAEEQEVIATIDLVAEEQEEIATIDPVAEEQEEDEIRSPLAEIPPPPRARVTLDDVLSGEADLKEQAEAYPELVEELQDIADIASLLQDAGRARRRLGEQILRGEIFGESKSDKEEEDEEADG